MLFVIWRMFSLPVFLFTVALSTLVAGQIQRLTCDANRQVCYTFHYLPLNHSSATAHCRQHHANGRLVTIADEHIQRWLDDGYRNFSNITEYWIGAKMEKLDRWTWIDGSPYTEMERITFPPIQIDVSGYASIRKSQSGSSASHLQLNITPSDEPTKYLLGLCQTTDRGKGRDRFFELPPQQQTKRWDEARARCNNLSSGADLAVLSNEDILSIRLESNYEYFIGLSNVRLVQDRAKSNYTNWQLIREPAGVDNNGCVYSKRHCTSPTACVWNWCTSDCSTPRPFVCQHDNESAERTTTTTDEHLDVPTTPATSHETTHQAPPPSAATTSSPTPQASVPYIALAAMAVLIIVAMVVIIGAMRYYHNKSTHASPQAFNNNIYQTATLTDQPTTSIVPDVCPGNGNPPNVQQYATVDEIQKRKKKQKPTTSFESHPVSPDEDASGADGTTYASIVSAAEVEPRQIRRTDDRPHERLTQPIVYASLEFN